MDFFLVGPEVAGGLGENAIIDTATHPPLVRHLHYELADWLGDVLLETFPVFIIEGETGKAALNADLTGFELAPVEITVTPEAEELLGTSSLPEFHWLKVQGVPGRDDFGQLSDATLVVSERALSLLRKHGLTNCTAEPYAG